jgi:hypothetical protein
MALLSFRGISTPSLPAQGEQRRSSLFNIPRDIPRAETPDALGRRRRVTGRNKKSAVSTAEVLSK